MKIKQITENTTSGSIATVDTALGGTQSRGNPIMKLRWHVVIYSQPLRMQSKYMK